MSIRVHCPGCEASLSLSPELAGKKIRCKKCDTLVTVPAARKSRDDDDDDFRPSRSGGSGQANAGYRSGAPKSKAAARGYEDDDDAPRKRFRGHDDDEDEGDDEEKGSSNKGMKLALIAGGAGVTVIGIVVILILALGGRGGGDAKEGGGGMVRVDDAKDALPAADAGKRDKTDAIKIDPERDKRPPVVEIPKIDGPLPATIDAAMVQKVKKSTAFLRVSLPGGSGLAEGSGFFAYQSGILLTNAHVLGMLNADSRRPKDVKVIINSGEKDERTFAGEILGVDRSSDLAVVRVPGDAATLPPPLPVSSAKDLTELQKVYIFGFPYGSKLGKNITVSESSVSSIRKDDEGMMEKVQVNGGMHPGNSGGPVVDSRGHVIGVSVSGIVGTNINFAVPGDFVHTILDGRVAEFGLESPYLDGGALKSNVRLVCIDPLNRIREARVEVWTGAMGKGRPPTSEKPAAEAGDSERQSYAIVLKNGEGSIDIPVAPLPEGKVYYFQPVVVNGSDKTKWAGCGPYVPPAGPPFERRAAELRQKLGIDKRTLSLKSSSKLKIPGVEKTKTIAFNMQVDLMEQLRVAGGTTQANLSYRRARMGFDIDGFSPPRSKTMQMALAGLAFVSQEFTIDSFGNPTRSISNMAAVPALIKEDVADLHDQIVESLGAITIPVPNRLVNPRETWTGVRPLMLVNEGKPEMAQMEMVYTYDGCRKIGGRDMARISFTGRVIGAKGKEGASGGKVDGTAIFDVADGYVTDARVDVSFDMDMRFRDGEVVPGLGTLRAEAKRVPGDVIAKDFPKIGGPGPGPFPGGTAKLIPPLAKSKNLWGTNAALTPTDFPDNVGKGRAKVFTVKMRKGKQYQIDVVAKGFDPMVRVENAKAERLGEDDDGGGDLNSRLIFTAPADGMYRVVVTSFNANEFGFFNLQVKEETTK